jgi:hypothetical protein
MWKDGSSKTMWRNFGSFAKVSERKRIKHEMKKGEKEGKCTGEMRQNKRTEITMKK